MPDFRLYAPRGRELLSCALNSGTDEDTVILLSDTGLLAIASFGPTKHKEMLERRQRPVTLSNISTPDSACARFKLKPMQNNSNAPSDSSLCVFANSSLPPSFATRMRKRRRGGGGGRREAVCTDGEAGVAVKEAEGTSGSIWSDSWFRAKRNHHQML